MKSKLVLRHLILPSVFLIAASNSHAASAVWNLDAPGDWATDGNWDTASAPGATSGTTNTDTATFGNIITVDQVVTVDSNRNISVIDFNANSKLYTLSGGSLVLSSGGSIKTSGAGATHNADIISSPITLANADAATSGTLSILGESSNAERGLVISGGITGAATAGASTLTLGGTTVSGTAVRQNKITGDIADGLGGGTLAVEKTGSGLWILEGAKTFTGGLTVREGELRLAANAAAAGTSGITLGDTTGTAAATLMISNSFAPTNALTVAAGSSGTKTLLAGTNVNPGYNGAITLNDSLAVSIGSTSNTNSFAFTLGGTSGISLNANTLTLRLAPTTSGAITNTINVNKAVSGTGDIAIVSTGSSNNPSRIVNLNGTNTYTGGTTVAATGTDKSLTVNVSGDQSSATGGWTISNPTPNSNTYTVNFLSGSTIAVAAGKNMELLNGGGIKAMNVAGTVTTGASGNLLVRGNSNLNLDSGANWTQNGGTINIQPQNSSTNAVMNVNSGGSFTYAGGNDIVLAKATSAGAGSATLNLSGGTFNTGRGFSNNLAGTGTGTTNLNFSGGGTLKLSTNIASLVIQGASAFNVSTGTGGGVIDTNGFSTAIDVGISGDGGLTKAGSGTLALNAANTYAGATTVTGGTLSLGVTECLDDASDVVLGNGTLNIGAGFTDTVGTLACNGNATINLGTGATLVFKDSNLTDWTGGSLNITGDFTHTSVKFATSGGLGAGQLAVISVNGSGAGTYTLDASGYLVAAPAGTPYETWATGDEPFDGDANGDGVQDGLAFLLGAATPGTNATGLLPIVSQSGGDLVLSFSMRDSASRGSATLGVEHSKDLGIADPWTTVLVTDTNSGPTNGVTFSVTGSGLLSVTATVDASAADGTGNLFGRLKAVNP